MQTYKKKFNSNEKKINFINKANITFLKKVKAIPVIFNAPEYYSIDKVIFVLRYVRININIRSGLNNKL